jgi:phage terminase large subunit-like protein
MKSSLGLTNEEKTKILAVLAEMESRNQTIPEEVRDALFGKSTPKEWAIKAGEFFPRKDGRLYTPYSEQEAFTINQARFVGFKGSRGSGKSSGGAQKALEKIRQGLPGAVVNPDFENFKISTWPEFREWIPWGHVVRNHRHRQNIDWIPDRPFVLAFDNGSYVYCKGLKDANSARGPNINWLWYDEAQRDPDGIAWKYATASVRVGTNPQAWATYTPNGTLHWTYKFFTKQEIPEEIMDLFRESDTGRNLIEVFHGTIEDNKNNLDPGFYASMRAMYAGTGWLERQEIFGEDVAQEGAVGGAAADALKKNTIAIRPSIVTNRVRFWDLAATEKKIIAGRVINDPDETVGTLMSVSNEIFYLENQVCGFWEWDDLKKYIRDTAGMDGPSVRIYIEQEPASGGKNQVAELSSYLKSELGWASVEGWLPRDVGDRVMGANYWFAEAKQDLLFVVDDGTWDVRGMIDQIQNFPIVRHDDRVTSITGARYNLAPIKRWKDIPFMKL